MLFWALIVIVVGSTACGWLGTLQHNGVDFSFWLGNQGLEFTSMGRVWQILLFVGLLFWLLLHGPCAVAGAAPPVADPRPGRDGVPVGDLHRRLLLDFAGVGPHTHYSMVEYWRWWLVHLWVEGFFEVFATAVVALIFTRLGLVKAASANRAIVLETIVFLFGGILGTLHHLYWTGTPTSVIAVGAVFSALEVVPLALLGFEGWQTYRRIEAAPWVKAYKWVIMCFVAVGFWNTVGAGLLGFAINPPASLYYVQGLNMTAAHGHAALFGVYGMLGIGLMLFCLRGLFARSLHADRHLAWMFWSLNAGLAMMVFMSLLPAGIYQAFASVSEGLWFARSPAIVHSKVMETLVWLRVPGDVVFAAGGLFLARVCFQAVAARAARAGGGDRAAPGLTAPVVRRARAAARGLCPFQESSDATDHLHRLQPAGADLRGRPARGARHHRPNRRQLRHLRAPPDQGGALPRQVRLPHQRARPRRWPDARATRARHQRRRGGARDRGRRGARRMLRDRQPLHHHPCVPPARRAERGGRARSTRCSTATRSRTSCTTASRCRRCCSRRRQRRAMADAATAVPCLTAWQCIGCGRLEAPQNCVGICQDRKVELVLAADYRRACAEADAERAHAAALEGVVRRLAGVTPHPGEWQRTYEALQAQARAALVPGGDARASPRPAAARARPAARAARGERPAS